MSTWSVWDLRETTADAVIEASDKEEAALSYVKSHPSNHSERSIAVRDFAGDDSISVLQIEGALVIKASVDEIRRRRQVLEQAVETCKQDLENAEDALEQFQTTCPHEQEHFRSEYDFVAHWCDDCGRHWSTRR
jgi:hypothetical protein